MLRVTIQNEMTTTRFVVEGKLKGPWVAELQKCWQTIASAQPHKTVLVDLTEVTFVDADGGELLASMHQSGAMLITSGLMTQMISEVIRRCDQKKIP